MTAHADVARGGGLRQLHLDLRLWQFTPPAGSLREDLIEKILIAIARKQKLRIFRLGFCLRIMRHRNHGMMIITALNQQAARIDLSDGVLACRERLAADREFKWNIYIDALGRLREGRRREQQYHNA